MRVLLVKTSSLGDVIHTLPALTDAVQAIPDITFDWLVEPAFAEVPRWHPAVGRVVNVALRRWRRAPFKAVRSGEWRNFTSMLQQQTYHCVIDAQGLLKSAFLTRYGNAPVYGLDKQSAREPLAARFYQHPIAVPKGQHAVERTRQLFAAALGYSLSGKGQYRLSLAAERAEKNNRVLLLHGTTWASKHWPVDYWQALAKQLLSHGYQPLLPWGNDTEEQRANQIAAASGAQVLPKLSLTQLAETLAMATACVAVDTGLGHLAAAVGTPTIALFGATNSQLTGFYGENQLPLQSDFHCSPCMSRTCKQEAINGVSPPCFVALSPDVVMEKITQLCGAQQSVDVQ